MLWRLWSKLRGHPPETVLHPERLYDVRIDGDDIVCRAPHTPEVRLAWSDLRSVYLETNDSGPWGMDLWWILEAGSKASLAFPQGAKGEAAVLERLEQLPGFKVKGMNSVENARFLCWRHVAY